MTTAALSSSTTSAASAASSTTSSALATRVALLDLNNPNRNHPQQPEIIEEAETIQALARISQQHVEIQRQIHEQDQIYCDVSQEIAVTSKRLDEIKAQNERTAEEDRLLKKNIRSVKDDLKCTWILFWVVVAILIVSMVASFFLGRYA